MVGCGILGSGSHRLRRFALVKFLRISCSSTLCTCVGGLDFTPQLFIPSLPLATAAAFTGVLLPIAFSFAILSAAFGYPQLHAFSCVRASSNSGSIELYSFSHVPSTHVFQGAALASTSLGTTFFVLRSQTSKFDLGAVRLGSVLTGAALIDDIIALVLLSYVLWNSVFLPLLTLSILQRHYGPRRRQQRKYWMDHRPSNCGEHRSCGHKPSSHLFHCAAGV